MSEFLMLSMSCSDLSDAIQQVWPSTKHEKLHEETVSVVTSAELLECHVHHYSKKTETIRMAWDLLC